MDYIEMDILGTLLRTKDRNQRAVARNSGYSVGAVNHALRSLKAQGYIDGQYVPTQKTMDFQESHRPQRAVILAAGYGLRMIPVNQEMPKGLITIEGTPLIEHTIAQLREVGINEIHVVTGYMKERYEYLSEAFGVHLVYCADYQNKNNLYSLACLKGHLSNAYIIPSDVYCYLNPFRSFEPHSWYLLSQEVTDETDVRLARNNTIRLISEGDLGNRVLGIAYLSFEDADSAEEHLRELTAEGKNKHAYWEEIITSKKQMVIPARLFSPSDAVEINTYQQLREVDYYNKALQNDIISTIQNALNVSYEEISDISVLKKGLTNRSFLFTVRDQKYIMRVPGEGTEAILDRRKEARIYKQLEGKGFCDDNIYFDPEKGYKISRYIENARVCNDEDPDEVRECLQIARRLHNLKLRDGEELHLFEVLDYYEGLWYSGTSQYRDYTDVKESILQMRPFVEAHAFPQVLSHLDCNPDNFLISVASDGRKKIDLIDWEYAGMHDPLADLAAFISYRWHENPKEYADMVIDAYFTEGCSWETRLLVYCYTALWGLYNSNWCEYRQQLGVELGEFPVIEYRYAKVFSRLFHDEYLKYSKGEEDHG